MTDEEKPYFTIDGHVLKDSDGDEHVVYRGDFQGVLDISNGIPPKLGPFPANTRFVRTEGAFLIYEIVSKSQEEKEMTDRIPEKIPTQVEGLGLYNLLEAVQTFMEKGDQPFNMFYRYAEEPYYRLHTDGPGDPTCFTNDLRKFRQKILLDEVKEYTDAEAANDAVEILDGLLDIVFVAWGTALSYFGPKLVKQAAHEVAFSNFSKVFGEGLPIKREDGKIMKPEGWLPPDIKGVLDGTAGY